MNHIELAFRNLTRRPVRSLLTVIGVGFAVGSFITLYGLSRSVNENAQQSLDERGAHLTISRRGSAELFGGTIAEASGARLSAIPGIRAITGELLSLAATDNETHVLTAGWTDDSFFWRHVPLEEGRLPGHGERKVALVGAEVASTLHKRLGDNIAILGEKFRIIGITRYTSVINRNAVLVPLADLQEVTFRPGVVTFLQVRLAHPENPAEVERVSLAIEAAADVTVSTSDAMLRSDRFVAMLRAISTTMAWIALLMGVLMVLNTLLMAVLERTREIGIMSAIGWSSRRIMGALIIEGLMLSAIGSIIGTLLGLLGSQMLNAVPAIGRYFQVAPTPGLVAATVISAVALGILGSLYPGWVATRLNPAAALDRA